MEAIQVLLKILAAVLKLILFLRVSEILKNHRLLFFMKRIAEDETRLEKEFSQFEMELKSEGVSH